VFRRTVQGCWLPTPFASFPFTSPPVRHRVPSGSERAILLCNFAPPCVSAKRNEIPYRQGSREKCGCFCTCISDQTGNSPLPLHFQCKRREKGEVLRPLYTIRARTRLAASKISKARCGVMLWSPKNQKFTRAKIPLTQQHSG